MPPHAPSYPHTLTHPHTPSGSRRNKKLDLTDAFSEYAGTGMEANLGRMAKYRFQCAMGTIFNGCAPRAPALCPRTEARGYTHAARPQSDVCVYACAHAHAYAQGMCMCVCV